MIIDINERLLKVRKFNSIFGHQVRDKPLIEITDIPYITNRFGFIKEELEELKNAKNGVEILDALIDIEYFHLGTVCGFGLNTSFVNSVQDRFVSRYGYHHHPTDPLSEIVTRCSRIILHYHEEVLIAVQSRNVSKLINNLAAITCELHFMIEKLHMSIIFAKGFDVVHNANMDKLCSNEVEAENAKNYYGLGAVSTNIKKLDNGKYAILRDIDGKILKRMGWEEPDLSEVFYNIKFITDNYKFLASNEDDKNHYDKLKASVSLEWKLMVDGGDFAIYAFGDHCIINDCGCSSLYEGFIRSINN